MRLSAPALLAVLMGNLERGEEKAEREEFVKLHTKFGKSYIGILEIAIILRTENHGRNSKEHSYPRPHDYSPYYGAHQRISQTPQETTWQAAQPNSRPAT